MPSVYTPHATRQPDEQLRQSIAAALKLENIPLEFELRLIAAESLHAAGHSPESLAHLADTPARARAAGFVLFANRADKIHTAAQAGHQKLQGDEC